MKRNSNDHPSPQIFSKLSLPKATIVYDDYWRFAAERQEIFFKRLAGEEPPWTSNAILGTYKFTNAYRASDRVSQYLIRHVIYVKEQTPEQVFFRIMMFKLFNKIETWLLLEKRIGSVDFHNYSFRNYNNVLGTALRSKSRIYSAAYIMASGKSAFGHKYKHSNHLKLVELMMRDSVPERITQLKSLRALFELLRSYPSIGDFLGYQYAIDLNYSDLNDFNEMEFIVPGPGAIDGIHKCFSDLGGLGYSDIIKMVADRQAEEFEKRGIKFRSLWGRPLQLIDCQNLFCEIGKYSRIAHPEILGLSGRKKIKQRFKMHAEKLEVWYPPKWKLRM